MARIFFLPFYFPFFNQKLHGIKPGGQNICGNNCRPPKHHTTHDETKTKESVFFLFFFDKLANRWELMS